MDRRVFAAKLYVNALRTGEASALTYARRFFSPEIELARGTETRKGPDAVSQAVAGQWPMSIVYLQGAWTQPTLDGDTVRTSASFPTVAAKPEAIALSFTFDAEDRIVRIQQDVTPLKQATPVDVFPDIVRAIVNSAMAMAAPMAFACCGADGKPQLTLRGGVQVYSTHELSLWLRHATGGSAEAVRTNPHVSLLYRDSRTRTTLSFEGVARVVDDPEISAQIFELMPEVEQTHDLERKGAAMIVDVTRVQGFTMSGPIRMERTRV